MSFEDYEHDVNQRALNAHVELPHHADTLNDARRYSVHHAPSVKDAERTSRQIRAMRDFDATPERWTTG